jgi:PIN domain nuclease of toxin-antitoxin system
MKVLLDTHAFIWWDSAPARLSARALSVCESRDNTLLVSVASVWEMQIKTQLGKLKLSLPLTDILENQRLSNGVEILPITLPHVLAVDQLPLHHKDPFDRLLIAQANVEEALLVSHDPMIATYPCQVVW